LPQELQPIRNEQAQAGSMRIIKMHKSVKRILQAAMKIVEIIEIETNMSRPYGDLSSQVFNSSG